MATQATKMSLIRPDQSEPAKQRRIAALAFEYWLARGFRGGSPAEDWLRAERVVRGKEGAVTLKVTPIGNFLVA